MEAAFGRFSRRQSAISSAAVVINIAFLFLLTCGISLLSSSYYDKSESNESCISINHNCAKRDPSYESLLVQIREQNRQSGLITRTGCFFAFRAGIVCDRKNVSEVSVLYADPAKTVKNPYVYRLDDDSAMLYCTMKFLPDDDFDALVKNLSIKVEDGAGIFVNTGEVFEWDSTAEKVKATASCRIFTEKPASPLPLYALSAQMYDELRAGENDNQQIFPVSAREYMTSAGGVSVPIACIAAIADVNDACSAAVSFAPNDVILPFREIAAYTPLISKVNQLIGHDDSYYGANLYTTDSKALNKSLRSTLTQQGYMIDEFRFGDGEAHFAFPFPDSSDVGERNNKVELFDPATHQDSFESFLRQTSLFYRLFALMTFLSVTLNVVSIVHANRISRRREYAILTSLGLSTKQRFGMIMYESTRFTVRVTLLGFAAAFLLAGFFAISAGKAYIGEGLQTHIEDSYRFPFSLQGALGDYLNIVSNVFIVLRPYLWFALLVVLFVFFSFIGTELLVQRRFEKEELIAVLKDDLNG